MRKIKKGERLTMTVSMQVTEPQALALQAMFRYWNTLGAMGSSRDVAFFVDGDGNFRPNCQWMFSHKIAELTPELAKLAIVEDKNGNRKYDFDPIAWQINTDEPRRVKPEPTKELLMETIEEDVIEPGEELRYYIGMSLDQVTADLTDKGVNHTVFENYYPHDVAPFGYAERMNLTNVAVVHKQGIVTDIMYA